MLVRLHHTLGLIAFTFVLLFAATGWTIVHVRWGTDEQGLNLSPPPSPFPGPAAAAERIVWGRAHAVAIHEDMAMDWRRKRSVPVYAVRMDDAAGSTIYVDRRTGDFVNLMNRRREFILWANRLHRLDFFGPASPWILDAACLLLAALSLSGIAVSWQLRRRGR